VKRGWQPRQCFLPVLQPDVGVFHRLTDVCVTGEFLRFHDGSTRPDQARDVAMATGCMEVGNTVWGLVGDANSLQVLVENELRLLLLDPGGRASRPDTDHAPTAALGCSPKTGSVEM
jgi:hypothetical protein